MNSINSISNKHVFFFLKYLKDYNINEKSCSYVRGFLDGQNCNPDDVERVLRDHVKQEAYIAYKHNLGGQNLDRIRTVHTYIPKQLASELQATVLFRSSGVFKETMIFWSQKSNFCLFKLPTNYLSNVVFTEAQLQEYKFCEHVLPDWCSVSIPIQENSCLDGMPVIMEITRMADFSELDESEHTIPNLEVDGAMGLYRFPSLEGSSTTKALHSFQYRGIALKVHPRVGLIKV